MNAQKPLAGIRILDLTRLLPGPACARMLAEMGADVIKIEPPEGDYAQRLGLPADAPPTQVAPLYTLVNRGKQIERIDLKTPEGREALLKHVAQADALIEGFRPGVMKKLGLDFEALSAVNPRLVFCAITGYGSNSIWSHRAGHDINYLAMSGVLDQMGERGRPPSISNWQIADLAGGALAAAMRICAALVGAKTTGHGAFVDVSMTHEVASLNIIAEHGLELGAAKPRGEDWLTGGWPCYGVYATADQRFLAVGALEAKFWNLLCDALGKAHLKPLGWSEGVVGLRVRKELADHFLSKPLAEWINFFEPIDCCVAPVLNLAEAKLHALFT
ncbi:MAG: CoA transferase [Betaproteobacteria bacterium]|nr:MAG: CoA transferase [Betaproteobacteria bacterium]